jgi:signal transduction histidine kinase
MRLRGRSDAGRDEKAIDTPAPPRRSRAALESETASLRARVTELEQDRGRLEDFAALVAHELVKPISLAQSCVDGLLGHAGSRLDAGTHVDLEIVATACAKARMLLEALLADAQQRDSVTERQSVDLARLVRDCVAVLRPEIERARARVEVLELPVVHGNAVLLWVVFRNLLANAVEHGFGPGREIRVSAEPSEGAWTFAVDSPGPPIPEEARRQMFEAVWRGSSRRRAGGAGLGLVLVRRIVERHGGEVGVTSPDDSTNRFFFTLPRAGENQPEASRTR